MEPSDEILMGRLKLGELEQLTAIYDRYSVLIFNYFLRMTGDGDVSNDLLQDVFERLLKYKKSFKEGNSFKPWLFQIARNCLWDYFRKRPKHEDLLEHDPEDTHEDSIEDKLASSELRASLMFAMSKLNENEREILTLYFLLEYEYIDIANIFDITINNARIRVYRALKQLKQILSTDEIQKYI